MHASFAKNAKNAIALHAVAAKDASAFSRKLPYLKASFGCLLIRFQRPMDT